MLLLLLLLLLMMMLLLLMMMMFWVNFRAPGRHQRLKQQIAASGGGILYRPAQMHSLL